MNKQTEPWYRKTLRWSQTNFTEDDPAGCDLDFWRKHWRRTHVQGVIINCGGIVAYYPSKYGLQYRAKMLGDRDFFKDVMQAAREEGLVVVARMDVNSATRELYDAHPDWFCVDADGEPMLEGGRHLSCVNSGYYKEFIPKILEEIIETYRPDGFADNSWKGVPRGAICHCKNCREKFGAELGLELPKTNDWDDSAYREWVRWSYRCRLENWDLFNETTKRVGGKSCLWSGMLSVLSAGIAEGYVDLQAVCDRAPMIFTDRQSRDNLGGFEQNAVNGTLLHMAADESVIIPESMACYVRRGRNYRLSANPKPETRTWMMEGIAAGISPWYHHIGGSTNDRRQFEIAVPLMDWHVKNEKYLYDRTDLANVGIVWSGNNADFYGRDKSEERVAMPFAGFYRGLARHRIPLLPVNAAHITRHSARIKTLILPDIAVLSDSEMDDIISFLENGGNLVMTGLSATLNADGALAPQTKLWKYLGLRHCGVVKDKFDVSNSGRINNTHSYIRLPAEGDRHAVLANFEDTDILAFGGALQAVETEGKLMPLASYIPAFPAYPPEFSWIRGEQPEDGVMFAGVLESGARVVYFAGDIDRCYGRLLLPDHAMLLANAVRWALGDFAPFTIDGPGHLDCKLYRQENRLILHMVNLSGAAESPGYRDEFLPVGPYTIRVNTGGLSPKRAQRTVGEGDCNVQPESGFITIELDRIVDHEMLIIE